MSLLMRLKKQFDGLMVEYHDETLNTYNITVKNGSKLTFDEFKKEIWSDWLKDMVK